MGPLFSLVLFGVLAGVAVLASFGVAKIFLPLKAAAVCAVLFVGFGGVGALIGLFGQALWLPPTLETPEAVFRYLGTSALCGLLLGGLAVRFFVTRRRSPDIRS